MPKDRDPFRKYVDDSKNRKWKCKFCGAEFAGSTPRIRVHLAGIPGYGIKACEKVEDPVRAEALETFDGKGSGLDKSTRGTSGKGTERTVFGTSQSVFPSDDASNPTDTQNSNRHGCALQQPSCNWLTGTGTASSCPQDQMSLPPSDMPLDNLDNIQQSDPSNRGLDAAQGNENASSIQQLPMDSWASSCLDFSELPALGELQTHLESETEEQNARGLSSFPNDEVLGKSMSIGEYLSLDEHIADGIIPDSLLHSTYWPDLYHSLPENLPESREAIVNTFEEIQTNELHNPTVGSSLQIDSSLDVDGANRLLDCGQPCIGEVVPVRSNTSSTDAVQNPGRLPLTSDKEDENDIRQFPSRTPMATIVHSLVPEASTNPIGPSSSHGLSRLLYIATMVPLDPQIFPNYFIKI
ncbi:hypothetical protein ACJRO7_009618 [Eucalyptus globulus]|uniref:BED-type domain-containing protein n=1 Tax=Eucalyptus globulus TaxID=34317 RepID=A0ABD3L9E8_EUCGL